MRYLALLRGINVGGSRKVDMKRLKATFEQAGMDEVRTYINSGNVIFRSDSTEASQLVQVLESAIQSTFGFPVMVILREADKIRALVEALPETWVDGKEAKCDIMFLGEDIDSEEVLDQLTIKPEIDDVRYIPGAVVWRADRSKITKSGMMKLTGTKLYANMTVRNCNTVRRLYELMQ
jgi:uncharacterized protein (DUF1697 family)